MHKNSIYRLIQDLFLNIFVKRGATDALYYYYRGATQIGEKEEGMGQEGESKARIEKFNSLK